MSSLKCHLLRYKEINFFIIYHKYGNHKSNRNIFILPNNLHLIEALKYEVLLKIDYTIIFILT